MPIGAAVLSGSQGWTSVELQSLPYTVRARRVRVADLTSFPMVSNCGPLLSRDAGASESPVRTAIVLLLVHWSPRPIVAACCHGPLVPLLPPLARLCILRDDRAPRGANRCHSKTCFISPTSDWQLKKAYQLGSP